MNSCYVLSLASFLMLTLALCQSLWGFYVFKANHLTFMILTSIVYFFTETLTIFFYVGTGVSIKEFTSVHKLNPFFHKRSIAIKRRVYPPQLLNIFFMIILFVLAGAVDIGKVSLRLYQLIFFACLGHFIYIKIIQHQCFRDNTHIVLEMSGIK